MHLVVPTIYIFFIIYLFCICLCANAIKFIKNYICTINFHVDVFFLFIKRTIKRVFSLKSPKNYK